MTKKGRMRAMLLEIPGGPLVEREIPIPAPRPDQVLVKVAVCGVCRTDLHVVDGELPRPKLPLVPGHEIVGTVVATGDEAKSFRPGDRVGIPWLGYTCGRCRYCLRGQENLCDNPLFTGYTIDGGYAEYTVADHRYCFHLPESYVAAEAAPLLCAGLIGYRSYRMVPGDARHLGIYGFGAAAHIIAQVARHQGKDIYAFTKPGDAEGQVFAARLGAVWTGGSTRTAARGARCGDHLRPGRPPGGGGPQEHGQGGNSRLRRHPHERHPGFSLSPALGGANDPIRRQPHEAGR